MARTDVHSPANLITEDYTYLASFDLHPEDGDRREHGIFRREQGQLGRTFHPVHGVGQCDHCGTPIRYVAYLLHEPTGEIVGVGSTCLDNRFTRATEALRSLMKDAQLDREAQRIKGARAAYAEANPDVVAHLEANPANSGFLSDLLGKLRRYGYLTERQTDAVRRNIERDTQRAAERADATPVPEGSTVVTGRVVSMKTVDGPYGLIEKMLVEDDRGFRVFGTFPSALYDGQPMPGRRVRFTATLEQSKDDATFGFYKRPRKAETLDDAS